MSTYGHAQSQYLNIFHLQRYFLIILLMTEKYRVKLYENTPSSEHCIYFHEIYMSYIFGVKSYGAKLELT